MARALSLRHSRKFRHFVLIRMRLAVIKILPFNPFDDALPVFLLQHIGPEGVPPALGRDLDGEADRRLKGDG